MLPAATHWWQAAFWEVTASSIAFGACYLAAAACAICPRWSGFAGLAMINYGIVWNFDPNSVALVPLAVSFAIVVVALLFAARALDAARH
jgi:hypothetical protein